MSIEEAYVQAVRESHLAFMAHCWRGVSPFTMGFHTKKICNRIDKALEDYKNGISSYIVFGVHPRAGKSQIISRNLPPHFLGEFPDRNVIMTTYDQDLALGFSLDAFRLVEQDEYKQIYSDVKTVKKAAKNWQVESIQRGKQRGNVYASSMRSGITGRGADLGIIDDYCKGREEAESIAIRDRTWNSFTNDFMTRLSPVHIVIILATPWHIDDIRGRIKKEMEEDPEFPRFEFLDFPAKKIDYISDDKTYDNEYLFEERYSKKWYLSMYSVLGSYASAALMDCSPIVRGGNILDTTNIKYHDSLQEFPTRIRYARIWDLGHQVKSKKRKDPDFTGGTILGFKKIGYNRDLKIPILELWVQNYIEFRGKSTGRDRLIIQQLYLDNPEYDLVFESTTDSIDAVNNLVQKLRGSKRIYTISVTKAKDIRILPMEPIFEAGNVHVLKASWNKRWMQGLQAFDGSGSTHDEMVDNISSGYDHLVRRNSGLKRVGY
ncbi:MAG: terminase large subunit domain-containing protein [Candidatus Thorarchaeota archaeon]